MPCKATQLEGGCLRIQHGRGALGARLFAADVCRPSEAALSRFFFFSNAFECGVLCPQSLQAANGKCPSGDDAVGRPWPHQAFPCFFPPQEPFPPFNLRTGRYQVSLRARPPLFRLKLCLPRAAVLRFSTTAPRYVILRQHWLPGVAREGPTKQPCLVATFTLLPPLLHLSKVVLNAKPTPKVFTYDFAVPENATQVRGP